MITAIVLGAGAGGGFPQWNSNATACNRARARDPAALPRTQASIAVSGDGARWLVLNASPDLRAQIETTPQLHPCSGLRSTPIAGVILASAEVDAIAGLLTLREAQRFSIFATATTLRRLDENPIFEVLQRQLVPRVGVTLGEPVRLEESGLVMTLFAVPGKVPLYQEHIGQASSISTGETVGIEIGDGGKRLLFIPGAAAIDDALRARIDGANVLFFDGTLWTDDEMVRAGLCTRTGGDMGHVALSGEQGTLARLATVAVGQRILIHLNNSNPVLLADSGERRIVEDAGWRVAFDGMEIVL